MERLIQVLVELDFLPENLQGLRQTMTEIVNLVRADEPDTRGYHWHVNDLGTRIYIIQCFNSAEALIVNLQHIGPFVSRLSSDASISKWQVFGNIPEEMNERIRPIAQQYNLPITVFREL